MPPGLIDSHCHLPLIKGDLDEILDCARINGVTHMLCVAVDLESFPAVLKIAQSYSQASHLPKVFASVGVHPNHADSAFDLDALLAAAWHPEIIAIGETGLDYYRDSTCPELQKSLFRSHIQAAKITGKPLIIHTRESADDVLEILTEEGAEPGVMHCFVEDRESAKQALDLGFYLSFSGVVTFKNATQVQDVARFAPLDRILVETDAPWLAPVPQRGKPNQPAFVRHTAEFIAALRGISFDALCAATSDNFLRLFTHATA